MDDYAIVINAGSSSLKFCIFQRPQGDGWRQDSRGQVDGIGTAPRLRVSDGQLQSILRLVQSQLDVTLGRLLE